MSTKKSAGRALCLPFLVWLHRFERPMGTQYPHRYEDRIRNFMLMHDEMGLNSHEMIRHYREFLGTEAADMAVSRASAEIASPFHAFDAVHCIWHEHQPERREAMRQRFAELAIERKVRWHAGAVTSLDDHIGSVLSHRRILEEARTQELKSIIVFEDENRFPPDAGARMASSLANLAGGDWRFALLDGPAMAYARSSYGEILALLPDDAFEVARLVTGFDDCPGMSMRQTLRRVGVLQTNR